MPYFGLLLSLLVLGLHGCGPRDAEVRGQVEARLPGCELEDWVVGEGDGAFAYAMLELRCGGRLRRCEVAFESTPDGWVLSESMGISRCQPSPPR